MGNSTYTPISCSYYDRLEELATTKKRCQIEYQESIKGIKHEYIGLIVDLYAKNKEEFMILDNGLTIRLDHLDTINGISNPSFAFKLKDR